MFTTDICLCTGKDCPLRESCKRFQYHLKDLKSDWNSYNTYFETPPYDNEKKDCDYHWEWVEENNK